MASSPMQENVHSSTSMTFNDDIDDSIPAFDDETAHVTSEMQASEDDGMAMETETGPEETNLGVSFNNNDHAAVGQAVNDGETVDHSDDGGSNEASGQGIGNNVNDSGRNDATSNLTIMPNISATNQASGAGGGDEEPNETVVMLEQDYQRVSHEMQASVDRLFQQLVNYAQVSRDVLASWGQVHQSEMEEASKLDNVERQINQIPSMFFGSANMASVTMTGATTTTLPSHRNGQGGHHAHQHRTHGSSFPLRKTT